MGRKTTTQKAFQYSYCIQHPRASTAVGVNTPCQYSYFIQHPHAGYWIEHPHASTPVGFNTRHANTATGFKTSHGALTQLSDHPKRTTTTTTTTTTKLQHKTKNRIRKLAFKLVIAGKSTNKKKSYQVLKRHTT